MEEKKVSNTSKAIKGMSSQTVVTIILGLVEIVSFSIMSRLLTQQDFGYYAALSAVLVIFNSFAQTGIGSAIIHKKDIDSKFINNAFSLALCFGVAISLLLFLLSDFIASLVVDASMGTPLKLMSLTILCHCMTSPYISILYKRLQFLTVGYINLSSLIITTVISIILAYYGSGYYAIITKTVLGSILTLIIAAFISRVRFSFAWDRNVISSIWNYSVWLMASVVFRNFSQQADRLLMSRLLSVDLLGSYNRPKEFVNQMSSKVNGIFDTALFPVLSGIQDNVGSLQRAFNRSLYLMNIFSIVLTMAFFFNSELIIRIFFGAKWMHLVGILQVLSMALIFNIDGRLADCFLRSLALTKSQFVFRIIETIIKFSGVIIGAQYGIYGVAIAVVLSNFIMIFIKVSYICNYIELTTVTVVKNVFASWQPVLIFAPVLGTMEWLMPHTLMTEISIVVVFCVLVIILFFLFPSLVGSQYKEEVYSKVTPVIISKFKKSNE